jgi:hypothetical protein
MNRGGEARLRCKIVVALVIASVAMPVAALAKGPSGSTEAKNGQVKCKQGQATPAGKVFVGPSGAEACSDDNQPPDGRIMLSSSGYAAIDGDPSNGGEADGFVRIDSGGPSCGTKKKHDASAGRGASCQPGMPPLPVP